MTEPSSAVEIATLAADLIKATEVNSLDDPQEYVEAMAVRWWDTSRRQAFRLMRPNFAKTRVSLSRDLTAPSFEYSDQYPLPNDYIILVGINDLKTPLSVWDYSIEGQTLLINNSGASSLDIIYIADVTSVSKWDPLFKKSVALELAINICYGLTGQKTLVKSLMEMRQLFVAEARAINGQERPPAYLIHSPAANARMRYTGGRVYNSTRSRI